MRLPTDLAGLVYSSLVIGVFFFPGVTANPTCKKATPVDLRCPSSNGVTYTPPGCCLGGDESFVINCSTEYAGRALKVRTGVKDTKTCIAQCNSTPGCVAATYDIRAKTCSQKSSVDFGKPRPCQNAVFAYKKRYRPSVTTTTTSKKSSTTVIKTSSTPKIYPTTTKSSSKAATTSSSAKLSTTSSKASSSLQASSSSASRSSSRTTVSRSSTSSSAVSSTTSSSVDTTSTTPVLTTTASTSDSTSASTTESSTSSFTTSESTTTGSTTTESTTYAVTTSSSTSSSTTTSASTTTTSACPTESTGIRTKRYSIECDRALTGSIIINAVGGGSKRAVLTPFEQCQQQCDLNNACVGFNSGPLLDACTLFSQVNSDTIAAQGTVAARVVSTTITSTSSSTTTDSTTSQSTTSESTTTESSASQETTSTSSSTTESTTSESTTSESSTTTEVTTSQSTTTESTTPMITTTLSTTSESTTISSTTSDSSTSTTSTTSTTSAAPTCSGNVERLGCSGNTACEAVPQCFVGQAATCASICSNSFNCRLYNPTADGDCLVWQDCCEPLPTTTTTATSTTTSPCPTQSTGSQAKAYSIECGRALTGDPIGGVADRRKRGAVIVLTAFEQCQEQCDLNAACTGFNSGPAAACVLFSRVNDITIASPGIVAARVTRTATSTTSQSTTVSSTSSESTTSSTTTQSTTTLSTTSESTTVSSTTSEFTTSSSTTSTTEAPITTTTSSTTSQSTTSSTTTTALKSGETYTARDGSQWLVARGTEILGTDIPGVNPVTTVQSYEESIELCARSGTSCRGVNFGTYVGSSAPVAYMKQALNVPSSSDGGNKQGTATNGAVDSAVRLTGSAGQSRETFQNGDFSSGSLAPWVSESRTGAAFNIIAGAATVRFTGSSGSNAILRQTFQTIPSGTNYYMTFDYALDVRGAAGRACNMEVWFGETSQISSAGSRVLANNQFMAGTTSGRINLGGVMPIDARSVGIWTSCSPGFDVTVAYDNLSLVTYNAVTGDGAIGQAYQPLLNSGFSDNGGSLQPWVFTSGNRDDTWTTTFGTNSVTFVNQRDTNSAGIVLQQSFDTVPRGSAYTFSAVLDLDTSGSSSSIRCQPFMSFESTTPFWQLLKPDLTADTLIGPQTQRYSVDVGGYLFRGPTTGLRISMNCNGGPPTKLRATISDVKLDFNSAGRGA